MHIPSYSMAKYGNHLPLPQSQFHDPQHPPQRDPQDEDDIWEVPFGEGIHYE